LMDGGILERMRAMVGSVDDDCCTAAVEEDLRRRKERRRRPLASGEVTEEAKGEEDVVVLGDCIPGLDGEEGVEAVLMTGTKRDEVAATASGPEPSADCPLSS
jgi:hypothetical protein